MKTLGLRAGALALIVSVLIALTPAVAAGMPAVAAAAAAAAPGPGPDAGGPAIVLVVDGSLSMKGLSGGILAGLVAQLGEGSRLGVVRFAEDAEVIVPLGPVSGDLERKKAEDALAGLAFDGRSTDVVAGLEAALEQLATVAPETGGGSPGAGGAVLLVSDGRVDPPPGKDAAALQAELEATVLPACRARGTAIYVVAYGDVDTEFLRDLSLATGGLCLTSPGPEALGDVLTALAIDIRARAAAAAPGQASPGGGTLPGAPGAGGAQPPQGGAAPLPPPLPSPFWPAAIAGVVAAIVAVVLTLVFARKAFGRAATRAAGDSGPSRAATPADKAGAPATGFGALSAGLTGVSERLGEAASDLTRAALDIEDFTAKRWQKEKEHEAAYNRVLSGIFLLLDHGATLAGEAGADRLRKRALRLLEDEGIEAIPVEAGHSRFDNTLHVSAGERPSDLPAGTILEVIRDGYWRTSDEGERPVVYRPAEVTVSGAQIREVGQ